VVEYIIVGTAGHVDHGKTVLVNALTGVKTDRLKEEKERGISIELGFAPLVLPSGRKLGLVDVPGHEKFIKQMLAGVGGMDLVLLVIAADEGVMPQTEEHLDIINLLQIKKGIVVVSKKDLVEEDWLELVLEEIRETLVGSVLETAPIIPVSAFTGEGIGVLKEHLDVLAAATPAKSLVGKVRLPIDRVFSITGFGTVVTGTLWSGKIGVGDILELQPENLQLRVRTLQVHGQKVEEALAGQRVAVNLAGVELNALARGSTLLTPKTLHSSTRIDIKFQLLKKAQPLENRQRVRIHLGTAEVLGRVILLEGKELNPGEMAFAQLELEEPLVAAQRDLLVIRSYSPMVTIGGGQVVDPDARRHRRIDQTTLERLNTKLEGSPGELLFEVFSDRDQALSREELMKALDLEKGFLGEVLAELLQDRQLLKFDFEGQEWYLTAALEERLWDETKELLLKYHQKYPLRMGFSKEELRSRKFSIWQFKTYNGLLQFWERQGKLQTVAKGVKLPEFNAEPNLEEQRLIAAIVAAYYADFYQPPTWDEMLKTVGLARETGEELLYYLLGTQQLVKVTEGLLFHREAIEGAKAKAKELIKTQGSLQLADMRDALNSSRKFVLPLLEYFDQIKFTKRIADKRVLFTG